MCAGDLVFFCVAGMPLSAIAPIAPGEMAAALWGSMGDLLEDPAAWGTWGFKKVLGLSRPLGKPG